jgi:hypothetical protein
MSFINVILQSVNLGTCEAAPEEVIVKLIAPEQKQIAIFEIDEGLLAIDVRFQPKSLRLIGNEQWGNDCDDNGDQLKPRSC